MVSAAEPFKDLESTRETLEALRVAIQNRNAFGLRAALAKARSLRLATIGDVATAQQLLDQLQVRLSPSYRLTI